MQYVGGKFRQAKVWAPLILASTDKRAHYLEPFLGGCNFLPHMAPHFQRVQAGDVHEDLMLMWQALKDGWEPPEVTKEVYTQLKTEAPSALRGFAGFGCAFGGNWFDVWARSAGKESYFDTAKRSVAKAVPFLSNAELRCCSFSSWGSDITAETVVYADPPYAGVKAFKGAGAFDTAAFWEVMRNWRNRGASVFVSEYNAPSDFTCINEISLSSSIARGGNRARQTDKLFC